MGCAPGCANIGKFGRQARVYKEDSERGRGHLPMGKCQGLRTGGSQRWSLTSGSSGTWQRVSCAALRSHPDRLSQKLRRWDAAVCAVASFSDDSGMLTFKNHCVCVNKLHCPKQRAEICGRPSCPHSTHSRSRSRMSGMPKHRCGWGSPVVGSLD